MSVPCRGIVEDRRENDGKEREDRKKEIDMLVGEMGKKSVKGETNREGG